VEGNKKDNERAHCRRAPSANAASYDKTLEKLHKLADRARALRHDIDPRRVDRAAGLTLEQIWHEYNGFSHLLEGPPKNDAFFSFLLQQLEVIIDLSNFAKECKAGPIFGQVPKGMDDRWYWEYWIVRLWNLFQRHDLNVSARKDIYKMKPGRESKFVLFVDQLQKFLPERSRQFTASYDALTQGIHRARESMQREIEAIKKRESAALARLSQHVEERVKEQARRKLAERAEAATWRLRDFRALLDAELKTELSDAERAELNEKMELALKSNDAVDLFRAGLLDAAEGAAMSLLERFPDAHDGYDRLGMVYAAQADRNDRLGEVDKAQKNKREAAECYRKAIEVIRRHPDDFGSSLKKTFEELVKQLDPPAKRARSGSARKGQSKPPAA
jgi:tetratricopeptide (TPR) repeat protein